MEACVLIGGLVFAVAVGYRAIDRLGRFLDRGGLLSEDGPAGPENAVSAPTGSPVNHEGCNPADFKVV